MTLDVDGVIEMTCPCCERYRCVYDEEKLKQVWTQQRCSDNDDILCTDCWNIFLKVMERFKKT